MVGGSMPIARAAGVDGTLGSFAGVRSRTADKSLLQLAQDAERLGFDSRDILKSTGWGKGSDGRWKYEIDDSQLKYDPKMLKLEESGGSTHLDNVLDHPELYKAYPELKDVKIEYNPYMDGASYTAGTNTISVGSKYIDNPGIIMHEVQHVIQGIEGFAKGGGPGKANRNDYRLKYEDEVDKLRPEFLDLWTKFNKDNVNADWGIPPSSMSDKEKTRFDYLRTVFNHYAKYRHAGDNKAYENYRALAGEVEANNVDTRLNLTARERIDIPPEATEDVARSQQIVRDIPTLTTPYTTP